MLGSIEAAQPREIDYLRVLSADAACVPAADWRAQLQIEELLIEVRTTPAVEPWDFLTLQHPDGTRLAVVHRAVVSEEPSTRQMLEDFRRSLRGAEPVAAAHWLDAFLPRVATVYTFAVHAGAERAGGWEAIEALRLWLLEKGRAVLQTDGEGFSNHDGAHILWQFDAEADGGLIAAVLDPQGRWQTFEMDLSDPRQVADFRAGRVPEDADPF